MTRIEDNRYFSYREALIASTFSDLAYNHREPDYATQVSATGWQGIRVADADIGPNGFSPTAGGYGVKDFLKMQSHAFAGKRIAPDGTVQFVIAFEGSYPPYKEPEDWIVNAGRYGWSRYYASLMPLMTEVIKQLLSEPKAQLILTGHSLGGAAAMTAFADLLAPQGNLWPDNSEVLQAGRRLLDTIGGWSDAVRQRILDATSLYTFGAPSFLIDPQKLGSVETLAFLAAAPVANSTINTIALLGRTIGALRVDSSKTPPLNGLGGISFADKAFQFEHANSSWFYPGDIVAQLGNQDPGTVLEINLENDIQRSYAGWLSFVPGGTHSMANYLESTIRLATNNRLLKSPNPLTNTTPALPVTTGDGTNGRNDLFLNSSSNGRGGSDLFIFDLTGNYSPRGEAGNDLYTIKDYDISITLDGSAESGRDAIIFDIAGDRSVFYEDVILDNSVIKKATFTVTASNRSSSITILNWDQWQPTDLYQVSKPTNERWSLLPWTDIDLGPALSVSTAPAAASLSTAPEEPSAASQDYIRVMVSLEPSGNDISTADLSINDLLDRLANSEQRANVVTTVAITETNLAGSQSPQADSRFFRLSRNRFVIDATFVTGAGDTDPASASDFFQKLIGQTPGNPGIAGFRRSDTTFNVGPDGTSVSLSNSLNNGTEDILSIGAELLAKPSAVSTMGYIVLQGSEASSGLSITDIRQRGALLMTSLADQDSPDMAGLVSLSSTLELTEGQRLAFFEVVGQSVANAESFTLLGFTQTNSQTVQLRTSVGMVVQLIALGAAADPGLAAYVARDQGVAPILNLTGLKATDVITGKAVLGREANFKSDGGFYRIEDLSGSVRDPISGTLIKPGQTGYSEAAMRLSVGRLSNLSVLDNQVQVRSFTLTGEALGLLAPFAIVNDGSTTRTYFAFTAANPDGKAHIRNLGANTFGLEDMFGGGDQDFDDLVVGIGNLTLS